MRRQSDTKMAMLAPLRAPPGENKLDSELTLINMTNYPFKNKSAILRPVDHNHNTKFTTIRMNKKSQRNVKYLGFKVFNTKYTSEQ